MIAYNHNTLRPDGLIGAGATSVDKINSGSSTRVPLVDKKNSHIGDISFVVRALLHSWPFGAAFLPFVAAFSRVCFPPATAMCCDSSMHLQANLTGFSSSTSGSRTGTSSTTGTGTGAGEILLFATALERGW